MSGQEEAPEDWQQRWAQLVEKIERVQTPARQQHLLEQLSHPEKPYILAFANAHAMNLVAASESFFSNLHSANMVLRDGSGMATLFNLLRQPPGLNLNGTDLIPQVLHRFNGRAIAIFGTRDPHLEKGIQIIARQFAPQSTYVRAHGFLDSEAYLTLATTHRPELIVLGMGMPRQEEVAVVLRSTLAYPCLIVCGGAIIDFLAGKTPRAPAWMQMMGVEWVFRLMMEPHRLFRRYVIGNPLFMTRAVRFAMSQLS